MEHLILTKVNVLSTSMAKLFLMSEAENLDPRPLKSNFRSA